MQFPRTQTSGAATRVQHVKRLGRQRPLHHISAHHDHVGTRPSYVREHRLQRRKVAMDVVKRRNPHRHTISRFCAPDR